MGYWDIGMCDEDNSGWNGMEECFEGVGGEVGGEGDGEGAGGVVVLMECGPAGMGGRGWRGWMEWI